jgi:hypothetical protein
LTAQLFALALPDHELILRLQPFVPGFTAFGFLPELSAYDFLLDDFFYIQTGFSLDEATFELSSGFDASYVRQKAYEI